MRGRLGIAPTNGNEEDDRKERGPRTSGEHVDLSTLEETEDRVAVAQLRRQGAVQRVSRLPGQIEAVREDQIRRRRRLVVADELPRAPVHLLEILQRAGRIVERERRIGSDGERLQSRELVVEIRDESRDAGKPEVLPLTRGDIGLLGASQV